MSTAKRSPGGKARQHRAVRLPARLRETNREEQVNRHWRTYFLAYLVETSNVTRSAEMAEVTTGRAYRTRQEDPHFAAQWRAALAQGYENLEMELLAYLRDPADKPKMDVANAIRLMAMHREEVARQRAIEDDRSEQEVLDSIDRMIDEMRQRSAANAALLTQEDDDDEQHGK